MKAPQASAAPTSALRHGTAPRLTAALRLGVAVVPFVLASCSGSDAPVPDVMGPGASSEPSDALPTAGTNSAGGPSSCGTQAPNTTGSNATCDNTPAPAVTAPALAPPTEPDATTSGDAEPERPPTLPTLPGLPTMMQEPQLEPSVPVEEPQQEPTEPEPTEPEPTEPTDPEPTEPEPTDPEPTDPEPTQEPESQFSIDLVFEDEQGLDPLVREAFESARERWERVIVGDLQDAEVRQGLTCAGMPMPEQVDDLVIFVSVQPIDGPSGVLGAAAPCLIRSETALPFAGLMQFDSADLVDFAEGGRLEEIVLHEMGHVLGIGSLWQELELLQDPAVDNSGQADTAFGGELAIEQFDLVGGTSYEGPKVPVENMGGDGVANGHWRESVFGNELMTPFLSYEQGLLSRITIASLEDLGYEVVYSGADEYAWPPPERGFGLKRTPGSTNESDAEIDLSRDHLDIPVYAMDESGDVILVR